MKVFILLSLVLLARAEQSQQLTIKTFPNNPKAWKSLVAAKFNGIQVVEDSSISIKNRDHKSPAFLSVNPFGKIPTLFFEDGKDGIFESSSILRYIARLGNDKYPLYGSDALEASKIDAWLDVGLWVERVTGRWQGMKTGFIPFDERKVEEDTQEIKIILDALNKHLANREYLVSTHITIADISLTCSFFGGFKHLFTNEFLKDYPHFDRWFERQRNMVEFKSVFGEYELLKEQADKKTEL